MKRVIAVAALTTALALAGCGQAPAEDAAAADGAAVDALDVAAAEAPPAPATARASGTATSAAPGAPAFAVVYPDAAVSGPATVAQGPDGPGGILSFTTEATPDAVIAFYRQRAEAGGLATVMAMNQGDARAYGAAAQDGSGQLLRVIATPVEDGPTSVQLDWTAGR